MGYRRSATTSEPQVVFCKEGNHINIIAHKKKTKDLKILRKQDCGIRGDGGADTL